MPCDEFLPVKLIRVVSKFGCISTVQRRPPLQGTFPARSNIGSPSEQRTAWQPDVTAAAGPGAARVLLSAVGQ